jgi:hypothetical protein
MTQINSVWCSFFFLVNFIESIICAVWAQDIFHGLHIKRETKKRGMMNDKHERREMRSLTRKSLTQKKPKTIASCMYKKRDYTPLQLSTFHLLYSIPAIAISNPLNRKASMTWSSLEINNQKEKNQISSSRVASMAIQLRLLTLWLSGGEPKTFGLRVSAI